MGEKEQGMEGVGEGKNQVRGGPEEGRSRRGKKQGRERAGEGRSRAGKE